MPIMPGQKPRARGSKWCGVSEQLTTPVRPRFTPPSIRHAVASFARTGAGPDTLIETRCGWLSAKSSELMLTAARGCNTSGRRRARGGQADVIDTRWYWRSARPTDWVHCARGRRASSASRGLKASAATSSGPIEIIDIAIRPLDDSAERPRFGARTARAPRDAMPHRAP